MNLNKNSKKVICSILLLCMVLTNLSPVFALTKGTVADIVYRGQCGDYITYTRDGATFVVDTAYVGFNENGIFHPAYCVDINLPGVSHEREYGVEVADLSELANNQALWRTLINGFPYKTPQEMGLESEEQAFMVTKQALYRVIDGESADGYGFINETGRIMANKIRELVDIGRNGTQTYKDPVINITKLNDAGVDSNNNEYISQTFKIDAQVVLENISTILNTASAPEGTYIADTSNNPKTSFNKGDTFKVLVPRKNITNDISIQMSFNGNCKVYPILFGKAPNSELQNYLLATDPFVTSSARATMDYHPTADIEINKVSNGYSEITEKEEGAKLSGAVFTVKSKDGTFIKEVTTDEYGKFVLSGLDLKEYIITEKVAPDYYLKGKDVKCTVEPKYDGDNKIITFENTPVVIKVNVDKDADKEEAQGREIVTYEVDNIKNLSNVPLDNFTLTDDLPKEVRLMSLQTGTYNEELEYEIEYSTNKNNDIKLQDKYSTKIDNKIDFSSIELEEDEYITSYSLKFGTVKIGFGNTSKMKVETKVIEGLEDKSIFTNNVKVSGIYLQAKTEDDDDVPVKVYENILKIKKTTKEYNQYTEIPEGTRINATFDLLDENKEFITTFNVNKDEDFIYKYLETGKTYYLKEISCDPYYVINKDLTEFKFTENGQVIDLDIKDDNVNLVPSVEKEAPTEAQKGEVITYSFDKVGNFSNIGVADFIWGDKLPKQVRIQSLETGTWNEELNYKIQYTTNKNTNWKDVGEFSTTKNNKIDFTNMELAEDEYVKEFRVIFGDVKEGFTHIEAPKVLAKVNEDVQNNKMFVNNTYVTALYQETKLEAKDEAHTVVYTKQKPTDKELPKTGLDN